MKVSISRRLLPLQVLVYTTLSMCLLFTLLVACKKNSLIQISTEKNISILNGTLEGMLLTGKLTTAKDSDGLALFCNNDKTLIALGGRLSQELTDPGTIEHAAIIYSSFGVVVQNCDTGQTWYYIQNDEKSKQRFQSLDGAIKKSLISEITETIKINIS